MYNCKNTSHQSPSRGHPCVQHPAYGRAHECEAHPYTRYWMPPKDLSRRKHQALGRGIFGLVRWLLEYVKAFKMNPHRMRRIRQSTMGKRVRSEQITKFVVISRFIYARDYADRCASDETQ